MTNRWDAYNKSMLKRRLAGQKAMKNYLGFNFAPDDDSEEALVYYYLLRKRDQFGLVDVSYLRRVYIKESDFSRTLAILRREQGIQIDKRIGNFYFVRSRAEQLIGKLEREMRDASCPYCRRGDRLFKNRHLVNKKFYRCLNHRPPVKPTVKVLIPIDPEPAFQLAPLKREGVECCDTCCQPVGELHREWCTYAPPKRP